MPQFLKSLVYTEILYWIGNSNKKDRSEIEIIIIHLDRVARPNFLDLSC